MSSSALLSVQYNTIVSHSSFSIKSITPNYAVASIQYTHIQTYTHTLAPLGFVTYTPPCLSLLMGLSLPRIHPPPFLLLVLVLPRRWLGPCWGAGNCRGPG